MGLHENLRAEAVSSLAVREAVTTTADTTLGDAIRLMREKKLGCVIVVDEGGHPAGMFTENMLMPLIGKRPDMLSEPLQDHVEHPWPSVKLSDRVADVLEPMMAKNVRFVMVVDDEGRLVGLTGQKGLMEYVAEHFPRRVLVQRISGKPYTSEREGA